MATTTSHALARIRTATPFGTTPSRWRVYQFHHQGLHLRSDRPTDSPRRGGDLSRETGPTGFEPATSRVTVECSNQAELRPLTQSGLAWRHGAATDSDLLHRVSPRPFSESSHPPLTTHTRRPHSPYGSRTRLCTVKGCRPEPIDERAAPTCSSSGNGIRTRVPALRGPCPSPLDDTAVANLTRSLERAALETHPLAGDGGRSSQFNFQPPDCPPPNRLTVFPQARRESNPQPPVLETGALPIELRT